MEESAGYRPPSEHEHSRTEWEELEAFDLSRDDIHALIETFREEARSKGESEAEYVREAMEEILHDFRTHPERIAEIRRHKAALIARILRGEL